MVVNVLVYLNRRVFIMELYWELKPVLLARSLTLNTDAAPYYKYMIGPNSGPLSHLCKTSETNIINNTASHAPCPATQGHIPYALL